MKLESYLNFLRSHVCIVCAHSETEPHHVSTRGAGGSDLLAVPLCRRHHMEVHQIGTETFEQEYDFEFRDAHIELLQDFIEEHWVSEKWHTQHTKN